MSKKTQRVRDIFAILSIVFFFLFYGMIGAIEQDEITLLEGAIRAFGFELVSVFCACKAGFFEY